MKIIIIVSDWIMGILLECCIFEFFRPFLDLVWEGGCLERIGICFCLAFFSGIFGICFYWFFGMMCSCFALGFCCFCFIVGKLLRFHLGDFFGRRCLRRIGLGDRFLVLIDLDLAIWLYYYSFLFVFCFFFGIIYINNN